MKTLTEHEKEYIRYQETVKAEMKEKELFEWTKALLNAFIIIAIAVGALVFLTSCGGREDDPTPTPAPTAQISSNLVGSWKVMKKKNVSGYIENTDASLYITVSANKLTYKLQNGGVFDGTGTIENASNADQVTLTNGTKLTMFKTVQSDGTQNFYFVHPNGLTDDIMVKKN